MNGFSIPQAVGMSTNSEREHERDICKDCREPGRIALFGRVPFEQAWFRRGPMLSLAGHSGQKVARNESCICIYCQGGVVASA
jgi:hypothetical protein